MDQAFDPLNLLILAIAVVIFFRLRSVLGRRTGNERPPFDPFAAKRRNTPPGRPEEASGNVISLPRDIRPAEAKSPETEPAEPVWAGFAEAGTPLAAGLEKIAAADRGFTPQTFIAGAKVDEEAVAVRAADGQVVGSAAAFVQNLAADFAED